MLVPLYEHGRNFVKKFVSKGGQHHKVLMLHSLLIGCRKMVIKRKVSQSHVDQAKRWYGRVSGFKDMNISSNLAAVR